MKNLPPATTEKGGHGSPEMLREFIVGSLSAVAMHAEHGCDYASIGNDHLLQLMLHHSTCGLRAAYETLKDLKELKAREGSNG